MNKDYENFDWHQVFLNGDGGEIQTLRFDTPPAAVRVGEFVSFSFCSDKGVVTKVEHYFSETPDVNTLRHITYITLKENDPYAEEFIEETS